MITNTREYHGLTQYLIDGKWQFRVTSFDSTNEGTDGFCEVETIDGKTRIVKIDSNNRILVGSKFYDRSRWTH